MADISYLAIIAAVIAALAVGLAVFVLRGRKAKPAANKEPPAPARTAAGPAAPSASSAPAKPKPTPDPGAGRLPKRPGQAPQRAGALPEPREVPGPPPAIGFTQYAKKISLIGDGGVGKTSLINRFVEGSFDDKYIHTIGTNIKKKTVVLAEEKAEVVLLIWDLQGQRNDPLVFRHMSRSDGAFVVCDLTRDITFNSMPEWISILEKEARRKVPLVIVGNKADLEAERMVTDPMLEYLASQNNATCILTSARTGANVEQAFADLARRLICKK